MRKMKDSGVEWIGEIPEEWETEKLKYIYCCANVGESIDKDLYAHDEQEYVFYTAGLKPLYTSYKDFPDWKYTKQYDLLMARNGTPYVYLPYEGAVYSDHIIRITIKDGFDRRYIRFALQNSIESEIVETVSIATWSISLWKEQILPMPTVEIQQRIADYLDSKCAKIDSIIAKQEQIIEKLKEYKLSLITEAVTKGLDPNVEMKDSGVEWFDKISAKARVTKVSHIYKIILGKMLCSDPVDDQDTLERYYCAANVHFEGIDSTNLKEMWFSKNEKESLQVAEEDLLVVEGGAGAGGAAIVTKFDPICYIQNSIMIVRGKDYTDNRWLYYTLYSLVKRGYIEFVCNKATIPHFTKEKLGNVPVVVVSDVDKKRVVDCLDQRVTEIDKTISEREEIINRYKAFKKSLIYEVVTGKKEV